MTGFVNRNSFAFRSKIIIMVLNRRRTVHIRQSRNPQRREMQSLRIWICVRNSAGEQKNSVGEMHVREKLGAGAAAVTVGDECSKSIILNKRNSQKERSIFAYERKNNRAYR